jgi:ethanolamine ammonia-lyase small subunit
VGLERTGDSLPTHELLALQLAHARAREAVHSKLNLQSLELELQSFTGEVLPVHSAARDRVTYLQRPDLGRRLNEASRAIVLGKAGQFDAVFVIADGLSATAIEKHAAPMLENTFNRLAREDWRLAPIVIAEQGRVAIGDEIAQDIGAALCVVLIGERPGLSSADSLGVYLSWNARPGTTDAERNCISNIRAEGLSYAAAAQKLIFLMNEARRRKLSGVQLKEEAGEIVEDRRAELRPRLGEEV